MTQDRRDDVDLTLTEALDMMAAGEEVELIAPPDDRIRSSESTGSSSSVDTTLVGQRSDDPVPIAS